MERHDIRLLMCKATDDRRDEFPHAILENIACNTLYQDKNILSIHYTALTYDLAIPY